MDEMIHNLIKSLEDAISQDNFIGVGYDVTEELHQNPNSFLAVEQILKLMERNRNIDFGSPGPLVHFVEKFSEKGYEEKLVESLERCPTEHTVWMLNRIINGVKGDKKEYFIKILKNTLNYPNLNESVKSCVLDYIAYQE